MLLHHLVSWQEKKTSSRGSLSSIPEDNALSTPKKELPGSLALLCTAHECLGLKSTCTLEQGRLLNYIVDVFTPLITGPIEHPCAEHIRMHLDQAIYCLYAHPSKKSRARHLVDHNVSQIGLK